MKNKKHRLTWTNKRTGYFDHGEWRYGKKKVEQLKRNLECLYGNWSYSIEGKNVFWENFWRKHRKWLPLKIKEKVFIYYSTPQGRKKIGVSSLTKECDYCHKTHVLVSLPNGRVGCSECKNIFIPMKKLTPLPVPRIIK